MNFRVVFFFISGMKKKFYLVFDWNFIESESDFGRMVIFVILSLQIHENM